MTATAKRGGRQASTRFASRLSIDSSDASSMAAPSPITKAPSNKAAAAAVDTVTPPRATRKPAAANASKLSAHDEFDLENLPSTGGGRPRRLSNLPAIDPQPLAAPIKRRQPENYTGGMAATSVSSYDEPSKERFERLVSLRETQAETLYRKLQEATQDRLDSGERAIKTLQDENSRLKAALDESSRLAKKTTTELRNDDADVSGLRDQLAFFQLVTGMTMSVEADGEWKCHIREATFSLRVEDEEAPDPRHPGRLRRVRLYAYTPLAISPKLLSSTSAPAGSTSYYRLDEELAFEEPLMGKFMWRLLSWVMTGDCR